MDKKTGIYSMIAALFTLTVVGLWVWIKKRRPVGAVLGEDASTLGSMVSASSKELRASLDKGQRKSSDSSSSQKTKTSSTVPKYDVIKNSMYPHPDDRLTDSDYHASDNTKQSGKNLEKNDDGSRRSSWFGWTTTKKTSISKQTLNTNDDDRKTSVSKQTLNTNDDGRKVSSMHLEESQSSSSSSSQQKKKKSNQDYSFWGWFLSFFRISRSPSLDSTSSTTKQQQHTWWQQLLPPSMQPHELIKWAGEGIFNILLCSIALYCITCFLQALLWACECPCSSGVLAWVSARLTDGLTLTAHGPKPV